MKKTIKTITSLTICLILTITSSITAFAETNDKPYTQMAAELVANEKDEKLRNVAISMVSTLTGETPIEYQEVDGENYVCAIDNFATDNGALFAAYALIGNNCLAANHFDGTYACIYPESLINQTTIAQNKSDLKLLYDSVQEVKRATINMNDADKVYYIISYIKQRVACSTSLFASNGITWAIPQGGTALRTGSTVCTGFVSLFYIFALNVGLEVTSYGGVATGTNVGHCFNMVYVYGNSYVIDFLVQDASVFDPSEYATVCGNWTQL